MPLTDAQLPTVKADILAQPDLNVLPDTADGNTRIAALYNAPAVPTALVWRTRMTLGRIRSAIVWTEYLTLTDAQRDLFTLLTNPGFSDAIDASDPNVQQGFLAVWLAGTTTRSNLVTAAKRPATRIEALLASGETTTFEGDVTYLEITRARQS